MFLKTLYASIGGRSAILQQIFAQSTPRCVTGYGIRFLYSSQTLGLDNYNNGREKTLLQFQDLKDKFYLKMEEFSDPNSHNLVFTEDLKNILHLAENKERDLKLVRQMLTKFNSQNKELRFGAFSFGPVVMRLYHHLNQPDEALEMFLDEDFKLFFSQTNSYHLLMDLLFKNERYEDVVKVFDIVEARQTQGTRYPRSVVILYLAALYKMNTPEALERVLSLYKKLQAAGHAHLRRAVCLAAALAVKQARYNEAIELLALIPGPGTYVTIRNLKLLAMSGVGRLDDVLHLLGSMLVVDVPEIKLRHVKQQVTKEVMDQLISTFESSDDAQLKANFSKLHAQLQEFDHVTDSKLDDILLGEIHDVRNQEQGPGFTRSRYNADNQDQGRTRYSNNYRDERRGPVRRPGLGDLS